MRRIFALVLVLSLCGTNAPPLNAGSTPNEQISRLLQLLAVDKMLAEIPLNGRSWAQALAKEHALSADQASLLEVETAKRIDATALQQRLIAEIASRCDEHQTGAALRRLADSPIAALHAAAKFPGNAEQRADFESYTLRMRSEPPLPERVDAVTALLGASRTVEQLVLINSVDQRMVEALLQERFAVASPDFGDAAEHVKQQAARAQRELLQTHSRDLYIYALRFTEQKDIDAATMALNDATVHWFVELTLQALETVLQTTKPPDPVRSP